MDDEIIVGINRKNNSNNKKAKGKKSKNKKDNKKKRTMTKGAKVLFSVIVAIVLLALLFSSPLFNIKTIEVEGNSKVSDEKMISISSIQFHTNIFSMKKREAIEKIKTNPYIEDVKIARKLPSTVKIDVIEREPRYMLQFADSYVYINNQGYMLEISNEALEVPILIGFTTDLSNIKAGNRINVEDLEKMNMVIKIFETVKSNDMGHLVSKIDISNEKNYTIILESEGKKVYLGDCSDLNTRILYLKAILEKSAGRSGEIFLNVDLNTQDVYFRPSN